MDSYNEVVSTLNNYTTIRQNQEIAKISHVPTQFTLPYRATYHKGNGEYSPSMSDKIEVYNYYKITIIFSIQQLF